jgi:hypothetical protein
MNSDDLHNLLAKKYAPPAYALFREVRDATGYNSRRSADALVMLLWPSRGLFVTGFELKVSRNDWLRELKNPSKAEAIARYCDFWFLVSPEKVIQPGELPPTWGHLIAGKGKLTTAVEATKNRAVQTFDTAFFASLCRSVHKEIEKLRGTAVLVSDIEAEVERRVEQRLETKRLAWERARTTETIAHQQLKTAVARFESESGVKLDQYSVGNIVRAVAFVGAAGGVEQVTARGKALAEQLRRAAEEVENSISEVQ